ncbi:hypothetical protein GCM10022267_88500 [Lentzea roselyniae]|uniref:Secreted protein n=1 Tax=Lentzea roselyniae TaxID=531940 RepID=A0ABP7CDC4_9PSEU
MRKLFAAGVAALMACLVVPPATSAETPAAASWCAPPGSEGNGTMNVFIVPTSGDNCGVLRMVAQLAPVSGLPTQTGFFRMYGPNGHIGDSTTKYWTYQESYRVDVNQRCSTVRCDARSSGCRPDPRSPAAANRFVPSSDISWGKHEDS